MRTAIYARVSTADKGQNPEVQLHELRAYCAARGWIVTNEIVDEGYSGSTNQRPGLKKLLDLIQRRHVDAVAVVKLDRLFRSLKHLVTSLDDFQSLGVCFVATRDALDYSTPSGQLLAGILGSLSQFERALIIERTKMGLEHARSIGKKLGRPRLDVSGDILRLRQEGLSYRAIQLRLGVSRGTIGRCINNL